MASGWASFVHLNSPGIGSFGVIARVPQKNGLFWAVIPVPPPPSNVNTLFSMVDDSIAVMSSPYEANLAWMPFETSSAIAWTPAAGSPDLWSR